MSVWSTITIPCVLDLKTLPNLQLTDFVDSIAVAALNHTTRQVLGRIRVVVSSEFRTTRKASRVSHAETWDSFIPNFQSVPSPVSHIFPHFELTYFDWYLKMQQMVLLNVPGACRYYYDLYQGTIENDIWASQVFLLLIFSTSIIKVNLPKCSLLHALV